MPFTLIPFLLLAVPLLEIGAFIVIGGQIGVLPTLLMVLVTAIIGSILLRWQGFGLLARIRAEVEGNRVPARELVHGVMILVAGVLLLTPGFVTDGLGFLLFVPQLRDAGWRFVRTRINIVDMAAAERPPAGMNEQTIDLDDDDFTREPDPSSPWHDKNGPTRQ
ncbi:MAG: FxsA family protein [Pseudomonadota bacterium]